MPAVRLYVVLSQHIIRNGINVGALDEFSHIVDSCTGILYGSKLALMSIDKRWDVHNYGKALSIAKYLTKLAPPSSKFPS